MFGVFGFILQLRMQHKTALNPLHCIKIEFILKTDVVKKYKENPILITGMSLI